MLLGLVWKYVKRQIKPLWEVPDNMVKKPTLYELERTCHLFGFDFHTTVIESMRSSRNIAKIPVSINQVYTYRILKKNGFLNSDDVNEKRDLTYNMINEYGIDYAKSYWEGYKNF